MSLFSTNNLAAISNNSSYIEAGIVENVAITKVRKDTTPNGNRFIEITFEKNGATATSTEWEPKRFGDQSEEDFQRACTRYLARLVSILEVFYPKGTLQVEANSFEELGNWFISKFDQADKTKKCRAKFVYNKSGYSVLASGTRYTFIEPMTVALQDSAIRKLENDVFERPAKEADPVSEIKTVQSADEMPF